MRRISQTEWNKTPKDYKNIRPNGEHTKLFYDEKYGTVLEVVEVVPDEEINKPEKYHDFRNEFALVETNTLQFILVATAEYAQNIPDRFNQVAIFYQGMNDEIRAELHKRGFTIEGE